MAGSLNRVMLIGRLGKDPEGYDAHDGTRVVKFSMATSESWRDKQSGERKEKTFWHNIVIFNDGIGKVAEQYCRKGSQIFIEGQLQTRRWTDSEDRDRYITEVVLQRFRGELTLLDGKREEGDGRQTVEEANQDTSGDMDSEIPF